MSSVSRAEASARFAAADGVELHLPRLLAVARRILGSDDLAWDAVQDALMALWHEQREPADLRGWLVRTVVHKSRDQVRAARRRRVHEEGAARGRERFGGDPVDALEHAELARTILRAIDALPREFGRVFCLCDVEELDYVGAARRLAVPIGTVRSRLHRARALLRSRLAHLVHDEDVCAICAAALRHTRVRAGTIRP